MIKIRINTPANIIQKFGLNIGGRVQQYIDNTVLGYCEPYMPKRSGQLIASGRATGTGKVSWTVPYAKRQYYTNQGNGLRGQRWFERMKADHCAHIVNGAKQIAKGG